MSRRRDEEFSSLELLTDTICNVFGGVLFIALMLAIISQMSGSSSPQTPSDSGRPVVDELTSLEQERELANLQEESRLLESVIVGFTTGDQTTAGTDVADIRAQMETIESDRANLKKQLEQDSKDNLSKQALLQSLRDGIALMESIRPDLAGRLKEVSTAEQRTFRLPRLHEVKKNALFFGLRHGKFYAVYDSSTLPSTEQFDEDVDVEAGPGRTIVEFRPEGGSTVSAGKPIPEKLQRTLSKADPAEYFLCFGVHPDSFAEFNIIKTEIVKRKYDYQWHPMSGPMIIELTDKVHAQ